MATYKQLKEFINQLTETQLETEVCGFDEFGDQVFWLTDDGMVLDNGHPILTGGTDFGQGYVRIGAEKYDLETVEKHHNTVTLHKL